MAKRIQKANKALRPVDRISPPEIVNLQEEHLQALETDPKYSLEVDPEDRYSMTDLEKMFVKQYINYRNVNTVAEICKIDQDTANEIFTSYPVQQEIRRINMALYQRRFASKMVSLDEISGYLSTMLTDEFVPLAEQLKPMEKLRVIETLLRISDMKKDAMNNPTVLMAKDIDYQIKQLSVATIKQLIEQKSNKENEIIVESLDEDNSLTPEEKSYLETLPTNELLKLVDDTNKNKKGGK